MKMFRVLAAAVLAAAAVLGLAQQGSTQAELTPEQKVGMTARLEPPDARPGEGAQVVVEFSIADGWHLYAPSRQADFVEVGIKLGDAARGFTAEGALIEPPLEVKNIPGFDVPGAYIKGRAALALPVMIDADAPLKGSLPIVVDYQACTDANCDRPASRELVVEYTLEQGDPRQDRLTALTVMPEQPAGYKAPPSGGDGAKPAGQQAGAATDATRAQIDKAAQQGPFAFMLLAFSAGLLALLTPCVWPMIPITVSFFGKKADEGKSNLAGALAFSFGIVITFTGIGILATLLFGATGVQQFATNPWINGLLAVLFIALALNLFGVYEIMVPSSWVNALNKKGSKAGGLVAPVLMGLAFSITSFTCTVPFAGTVLATAAAGGGWFLPTVGMASFATAFALPFFLLAMFPQWLGKLPKSGQWLVSAKVYMGFVELAFALKFISNIDLVFTLGYITREAFLAVWAALFTLASVYLMGWMKLPKEDEVKIGWGRRAFAVVNFGVVLYLLAGVQGAPAKEIAAFLPPDPYPGRTAALAQGELSWHDNIDGAIEQAKQDGNLIFVDFTGVTCFNCREMEKRMFPQPEVHEKLEGFVRAKLWTDRQNEEDRKNAQLQIDLTKVTTLPVYVIMTPDKKVLRVFQGYTPNKDEFVAFLRDGRAAATSQVALR